MWVKSIVELDAKDIVTFVSNDALYTGGLCSLVDDCRELFRQIPQTKIRHCFREANFCANALAKLGTSLTQKDY
jgi:hypothetical protein